VAAVVLAGGADAAELFGVAGREGFVGGGQGRPRRGVWAQSRVRQTGCHGSGGYLRPRSSALCGEYS
jgi:hypothetical protein